MSVDQAALREVNRRLGHARALLDALSMVLEDAEDWAVELHDDQPPLCAVPTQPDA